MATPSTQDKADWMPLTAVILAGGESRRMGRDKALVEFEGKAMWRRQLRLLQALEPIEILVSGPRRAEFPATLRSIEDAGPSRGPLAGLATALQAAKAGLVLVVAIDLPLMTTEFLESLRVQSRPGRGVVPFVIEAESGKKFYEPLAAIYPRECLATAERHLAGTDWSMQSFVRDAVTSGLLVGSEIPPMARPMFRNMNEPGDARQRAG